MSATRSDSSIRFSSSHGQLRQHPGHLRKRKWFANARSNASLFEFLDDRSQRASAGACCSNRTEQLLFIGILNERSIGSDGEAEPRTSSRIQAIRSHLLHRLRRALCKQLAFSAREDGVELSHGPALGGADVDRCVHATLCEEVAKLKIAAREGKLIAMPLAALAGARPQSHGDAVVTSIEGSPKAKKPEGVTFRLRGGADGTRNLRDEFGQHLDRPADSAIDEGITGTSSDE
jgi:hypothetical protein